MSDHRKSVAVNAKLLKEKNTMPTVGQKIRKFAESRYGTCSALAKKLGVSRQYIEQFANDKAFPGKVILAKLEKVGCSPSWLLGPGNRNARVLIMFRLRKYATKKYGSIREMARQLGMCPETVHQYASSGKVPSKRLLDRLRVSGIDMKWLLTGKRTPAKKPDIIHISLSELNKPISIKHFQKGDRKKVIVAVGKYRFHSSNPQAASFIPALIALLTNEIN